MKRKSEHWRDMAHLARRLAAGARDIADTLDENARLLEEYAERLYLEFEIPDTRPGSVEAPRTEAAEK